MEVSSPWNYLVILSLVCLVLLPGLVAFFRERPVGDGRKAEPYEIYTTDFDLVLRADDLPDVLSSISPDGKKGFLAKTADEWERAYETAVSQLADLSDCDDGKLADFGTLEDTAILILVDQSGSMRQKCMPWVAASVRYLDSELRSAGATTAVAGFTTAGWRGGFARQQWVDNGRPRRPGRLAALLHILYKSFDDQNLNDLAWQQMLNPDILRENLDGESIEWGERLLQQRSERRRVLLVISDGAPVDDSTLTQNGPSYLERHIRQVIARIQADEQIELCAVGINHAVDRYYGRSASAENAQDLINASAALLKA